MELIYLDNLSDFFIDLVFVATDFVDLGVLMEEESFFEHYYQNDEMLFETSFIDNYDGLHSFGE